MYLVLVGQTIPLNIAITLQDCETVSFMLSPSPSSTSYLEMIFFPQATEYTEYGLKIALLLVGLEYLVVQM